MDWLIEAMRAVISIAQATFRWLGIDSALLSPAWLATSAVLTLLSWVTWEASAELAELLTPWQSPTTPDSVDGTPTAPPGSSWDLFAWTYGLQGSYGLSDVAWAALESAIAAVP